MADKIENPVNAEFKSVFVESIPSKTIVDSYRKQFDIDVSTYFLEIESVSIYECAVTKYRFYYPFMIVGDGVFYEQLSLKKQKYYHKRWEHGLALKYSEPASKWLEVGSGNSFFLKELVERKVVATGLELNQSEVDEGERDKLKVLNQDFFSYQNQEGKFDVIALFQVLEHMWRVSDFFEKAKEMLNPNGKILFSVPNSNPYLFVFDKYHTLNLPPHHMGLWDICSIELVAKEFGFRVIECKTEILSISEFEYLISLKKLPQLFTLNAKVAFSKLLYRMLPGRMKFYWGAYCRKYILKGRNIFVALERV
jgi:SAM-dependent methyltransferase